jgi:hypothetical protein
MPSSPQSTIAWFEMFRLLCCRSSEQVEPKHVKRVMDERKAFFRRLLTSADYQILGKLRDNPRPLGIEGLGPLLHLKAVIFYPNGEGWYGLNPAVQSILDAAAR